MTAAIALDLGTTSIKAGLLAHDGTLGGIVARPAPAIVAHDGRYESDGLAYAAAADAVLAECLAQTNARPPLGLCSQRSSFLLWERAGGQPVTPLISWQDDRGAASCEVLRKNEPVIRALTGLPLTPYYLAPKLRVLLREHPTWREKLVSGVWLLGTLDTFLIWRWSGGKRHQTDASMAARTLLMDIRRGGWSPELCTLFDIPPQVLPQLTPSVGLDLPLQNSLHPRRGGAEPSGAGAGATHFLPQSADFVGNVSEVHLQASVGDQSAALLAAIGEGQPEALVNLGTGGFVVCYLPEGCSAPDGYLQTLVWQDGAQQRHQAVEGTLNSIAAALADYPAAACRVEDLAQDDIFCLAEPSGLGAPYFRKDLGLTFSAPVGHLPPQRIAALLLEGILFRVVRILEDFRREFGLERVYLSGGLSHLPALRQGLAHLVGAQLLLGDNCSGKTSSRSNSCAPTPDVSEVRPRRGGAEPSGAGQRSCGVGSCAQRVMPEPTGATHFLPQSAGFASNVSEVRLLAQKEASLEGVARLAAGIVQPVAGQGGKIDGGPPLPALAAKYQRWKVWLERLLAR